VNDIPSRDSAPLPVFSGIEVAQIEPGLERLLDRIVAETAELLHNGAHADWHGALEPIENLENALNRYWSLVSHLHNVADNDALRVAGGYAAGYYSYKWAEVLSADAFSRFEENGILDTAMGCEFLHCVLEPGGSVDAMELFMLFRGREPDPEALLRHNGIA